MRTKDLLCIGESGSRWQSHTGKPYSHSKTLYSTRDTEDKNTQEARYKKTMKWHEMRRESVCDVSHSLHSQLLFSVKGLPGILWITTANTNSTVRLQLSGPRACLLRLKGMGLGGGRRQFQERKSNINRIFAVPAEQILWKESVKCKNAK